MTDEKKIDVERFRLKRGRPLSPNGAMPQIAIRFPESMLDEIDMIIEDRLGQSDRTTVIREMVARGLEAYRQERKGK